MCTSEQAASDQLAVEMQAAREAKAATKVQMMWRLHRVKERVLTDPLNQRALMLEVEELDALFSDAEGNLVLVDLKRTDHDLSADVVPFKGKTCTYPLERFYANDFIKYQKCFYQKP